MPVFLIELIREELCIPDLETASLQYRLDGDLDWTFVAGPALCSEWIFRKAFLRVVPQYFKRVRAIEVEPPGGGSPHHAICVTLHAGVLRDYAV